MSKLLLDEQPVLILPQLAVAIGLNESVILQQINYWLRTYERAGKATHFRDGRWWVYNTAEDWQGNFPWWSLATIRRALAKLRDTGLVLATDKYNRMPRDRTLWYTIDREAVTQIEQGILSKRSIAIDQNDQLTVDQNDQLQLIKMITPLPETNTETNTETTFNENGHRPAVEHIPAKHDPEASQPNSRTLYPAAHLATEGMTAAWQTWVTHRAEMGKPISVSTYNSQMKWIEERGIDKAIAAIENSILHGYTGLVEPNGKQNGRKSHGTNSGYSRTTVTRQPPVDDEFIEYVRQATAGK
jgi:hypothetical protein